MAYDIVGLDLGSHSVKAMVMRAGMRGVQPVRLEIEPVRLGDDGRGTLTEVLDAAGRLAGRLGLREESVRVAMAGEAVALRVLRLPANVGRRLVQVIRFELDDALPYDIGEAVFDHVEIGRDAEGITVLSASALRADVKALIDGLAERGVRAGAIDVATLAYESLFDGANADGESPFAVIDLGHQRTNVAVIDPRGSTYRTILRGGRDLTARLAERGRVSFTEAEAYKHRDGLGGRVGEVVREAMKPLLREIKQTLVGHLASGGRPVGRVVLCGGGALANGMEAFIASELDVRTETFHFSLQSTRVGAPGASSPPVAALATALAKGETRQRSRRIDLRQGDLAFHGDREILRRRFLWVGMCLAGVLLSWMFATYAQYRGLSAESDRLTAELGEVTKRLFGKPLLEKERIEAELAGSEVQAAPIPTNDAFDILVEISRRIPPSVVHDVEELEIKPKRITIRGIVDPELRNESGAPPLPAAGDGGPAETAGDLSPTDLIQQKLAEFKECFTAIRMGRVQAAEERKKYQMDIDSRCP